MILGSETSIDFIGDIHGHAEELDELLRGKLGYNNSKGYLSHPTRKVLFVGDFIDRGPRIKEVLEMVKPMIDNRAAYTVIGNHEFNAICYWTKGPDGNYLREHSEKNEGQHSRTIEALGADMQHYIEWFKTLPIYIDNHAFRVVHAQWKPEYINFLQQAGLNNFTDLNFLIRTTTRGTPEYTMIDCLLKGEEVHIADVSFSDKDGNVRSAYRTKWWLRGSDLPCEQSLFEFPEQKKSNLTVNLEGYANIQPPVFFGHYWLKDNEPLLQAENVCCLDFSVAKFGNLVAYRWNGEQQLIPENFHSVHSRAGIVPSRFRQLSSADIYERLGRGETVYLLHWVGMSHSDEFALKFEPGNGVWVNSGDDKLYQVAPNTKLANDTINLNRYELTREEFEHFSQLKKTFY